MLTSTICSTSSDDVIHVSCDKTVTLFVKNAKELILCKQLFHFFHSYLFIYDMTTQMRLHIQNKLLLRTQRKRFMISHSNEIEMKREFPLEKSYENFLWFHFFELWIFPHSLSVIFLYGNERIKDNYENWKDDSRGGQLATVEKSKNFRWIVGWITSIVIHMRIPFNF